MKKVRTSIIQAFAVALLGCVIAFTHNAVSVNGINPFRRIGDVPVLGVEEWGTEDGLHFLTLEEVRSSLASGAMLIDSRTEDEYAEGHIPDAINLDYFEMGKYLDRVLPAISSDRGIIIYCTGLDCDDSEMLARELYLLGFRNLFCFRGGLEEWENSGLPVETGSESAGYGESG